MNLRFSGRTTLSCLFFIMMLFSMCRKNQVNTGPVTGPVMLQDSNILSPVADSVNEAFGGYYISVPPHYFASSDSFPLLVFLHGLGQIGDGKTQLSLIVADGIGKVIRQKRLPVSFTVNGEKFSLLVVSPQSSRVPTAEEVAELTDRISSIYRVKKSRIYLSGLSMGARVVTLTAAKYPTKFSAIVPIAGVANNQGMEDRCKAIADANLPVWAFHNTDDPMSNVNDARHFIEYITNFAPPVLPRLTIFDAYGHDAWTTALDAGYKENGMNIYEWMLQYHR